MNAKKLGFERNIHKLVYLHGSVSPEDRGHLQATVSPRGKTYFHGASELADANSASLLIASDSAIATKNEKTGDFERFLPFFRPCIFSEFHRSLLPFSMLCPDSDSRKGLNLIVISLLRAFLARRYSFPS